MIKLNAKFLGFINLQKNKTTEYINPGTYYSNTQLDKIISLLGDDYRPKKIVILEGKLDYLKYILHMRSIYKISLLLFFSAWFSKIEGVYIRCLDEVHIYVYAQDYREYDEFDKALYSVHSLVHELRHRWQYVNKFTEDEETDCDKFATSFVNKKSNIISKIMNWKDEWEVEEED
jgi:hypothetical protein